MKHIKHCLFIIISASCLYYSSQSMSLPNDKDQPINVSADYAEKNTNTGVTVYAGNVVITQGSIEMKGEKITIYDTDGAVDKIVAIGVPARFKQTPDINSADMVATGDTIEYSIDTETLLLLENALLEQEGRTTRSNKIIYDMKTAIVNAGDATGRVKMILQPTK